MLQGLKHFYKRNMEELIKELIDQGYLKSPSIIEAFYKIRRRDFLPPDLKEDEAVNAPLPIGQGQTISQPLTVAFMLELLQPKEGDKILDVGSGSGWQTAMLAQIVGFQGKVFGIERISELKEFGEKNAQKYNLDNIEFICGDGSQGLPPKAPFDKIIVAAATQEIPQALLDQLKIGGRLVIPIGGRWLQDIILVEKEGEDKYKETRYPGFAFVPLIEDENLKSE